MSRDDEPDTAEPDADEHERLAALVAEQTASTRVRIESLERDLAGIVESADTANIDDEHDPEGATIAYERALVISLLDTARATLAELQSAAERLEEGTYGRCEVCGERIPVDRLMARPGTTTCVRCS